MLQLIQPLFLNVLNLPVMEEPLRLNTACTQERAALTRLASGVYRALANSDIVPRHHSSALRVLGFGSHYRDRELSNLLHCYVRGKTTLLAEEIPTAVRVPLRRLELEYPEMEVFAAEGVSTGEIAVYGEEFHNSPSYDD